MVEQRPNEEQVQIRVSETLVLGLTGLGVSVEKIRQINEFHRGSIQD